MSRQIQIRRGTAAEHENFTGAIGEVTMDTTNKTLRVHDGVTVGGNELMMVSKFNTSIANCINEIPQDIKLELSSGTLTLKSGSKVRIPNGSLTPTQNTNLGSHSWNQLCFSGTKYVIIGNTGYLSTSDDGVSWAVSAKNTSLGSKAWAYVGYDGTKYIAMGSNGYISTSTNGTTWTSATTSGGLGQHTWMGFAYNGTTYIAIGYDGWISTSTDGTTWTTPVQDTNLGTHNWACIYYDGTRFIAFGKSGFLSTSTDGTTWATATQGSGLSSSEWRRIAFDGTKYVVVSYYGYVSTSTDLSTWTTPTQTLGYNDWTSVIWDGTKFIVAGSSGYVAVSVNGTIWGGAIFGEVTIGSDKTVSAQSVTGKTMVFYDNTTSTARCDIIVDNCLSGTSAAANSMLYNTSNNIIDYYNGSAVASGAKYSFPLAIVTVSNGSVISIDQIFNGIGYIGSTVFSFPGIKGLIPNGMNNNGSLKNNTFLTTDICTTNFSSTYTHDNVQIGITSSTLTCNDSYAYNSSTNMNTGNYCLIGSLNVSSGKITYFQTKTVFNSMDYGDFASLKNGVSGFDNAINTINNTIGDLEDSIDDIEDSLDDLETAVGNIGNISDIISTQSSNIAQNGYLKLSNGLIIQWGSETVSSSGPFNLTFPIAFSSATSYSIVKTYNSSGSDDIMCKEVSFYNFTATGATTYNIIANSNSFQWIAIGY